MSELETLESLSGKVNDFVLEDLIVKLTVVVSNKPVEYILNSTVFTTVSHIAEFITNHSSIKSQDEFNKAILVNRQKENIIQNLIETIISTGFSASYDAARDLTQVKQMKLLTRAEVITGKNIEIGTKANRKHLREFTKGATVIGGTADITSPEVADKPDFDEVFD